MHSFEAIQTAINGKSVDHAKKLGVSLSLVSKWQEPSTDFTDSGAYNPLDRIETIIETSRSLGNPPDRYLAPVYCLAERFDLIVIPMPPPVKCLTECSKALSKTIKEFGDLISVASEKLDDGNVSKSDSQAIDKEAQELIRQVSSFAAKVKEAAGR